MSTKFTSRMKTVEFREAELEKALKTGKEATAAATKTIQNRAIACKSA